jgi:hypothetical protein
VTDEIKCDRFDVRRSCERDATLSIGYELSCGHVDVWYRSCDLHGFYFHDALHELHPERTIRALPVDDEQTDHMTQSDSGE